MPFFVGGTMEKRKGKSGWVCVLKNPSTYETEYIDPANITVHNSETNSKSLGSVLTELDIALNCIALNQKEISKNKNEIAQLKKEIIKLNDLLSNTIISHNALLRAYKKNAAKTAMQLIDLEENN